MQDENAARGQVVVLMRHAEAVAAAEGGSDFERTLTPKGERDAEAVARQLAAAGWVPDHAICSAAWRTRQTFSILSRVWGGAVAVEYRDDLYLSEPESIARAMWGEGGADLLSGKDSPRGVLLIGHNPGIELLASQFAAKAVSMPPAAAAVFAYEGERTDFEQGEVGVPGGEGGYNALYTLRILGHITPDSFLGRSAGGTSQPPGGS